MSVNLLIFAGFAVPALLLVIDLLTSPKNSA